MSTLYESDLRNLTSSIEEIEDVGASNFHSYLRMFAIQVKSIYPKCSFGYVCDDAEKKSRDTVYVYHKDSPYVSGAIGYGNVRHNRGGVDTFAVYSRKIHNQKYNYGLEQRMFVSKHLKIATKHAARYLRDWDILEVATHSQREIRSQWGNTTSKLSKKVRDAYDEVVRLDRGDRLMMELQALRDAGHNYISAELGGKVDELLNIRNEKLENLREICSDLIAVVIRPHQTGNSYFTVSCRNISEWNATWSGAEEPPYDDNTLPENLRGKLGILTMCEPNNWVDNVGYKLDDRVFFVVNADVS